MATYTRRYSISDDVKKKQDAYSAQLASMPTYTSQYQTQLDSARDAITNRDAFKYDINADALYQQLRDQYQTQGQMAMMDTIGQATALTGGYGNSYAQNAGQQAYHGYLQQLNNQIPDLYGMALDRYNTEGNSLAQNYGLLLDAENMDYSRYQDQLANWQSELSRLQSEYNNALSFDYGKFRDEVADDMWQTQYDLSTAKASGGGSGGYTGGNPELDTTETDLEFDPTNFGRYARAIAGEFQTNNNGRFDTYAARRDYLDYYRNENLITEDEYSSLLNGDYNSAAAAVQQDRELTEDEWRMIRRSYLEGDSDANHPAARYTSYEKYKKAYKS